MSGVILDIDDTIADTSITLARLMWEKYPLPHYPSVDEALDQWGMPELVPQWQQPDIQHEMYTLLNDKQFMLDLPLITSAKRAIDQMTQKMQVAAYLTSRLKDLQQVSERWLQLHDLPRAPVISRHHRTVAIDWKLQYLQVFFADSKAYIDNELRVPANLQYQGKLLEIIRFKKMSPTHRRVKVCVTWDELLVSLM
jgi:hypothetical protein